jgi:hypothetical protein
LINDIKTLLLGDEWKIFWNKKTKDICISHTFVIFK